MLADSGFGMVAHACYIMSGKEVKDALVPGTLSQCFAVGQAIRIANEKGEDPVAAAIKAANGHLLTTARLVKKEGKTIDGLYYGTLELEGIDEFAGNGEGGDHARHIRRLTELLLERLTEKTDRYRLTRPDCRRIASAAMFHDIGKLDIPDEILNKPGKLTAEEFEIIKGHPVIGETILRSMKDYQGEPLLETAAEICRWHHERIDGRGYPDGLRGEEIPIAAQAAGLADVFDALVSRRVYKEPYPMEKAMEMIAAGECGAFDPLLTECLRELQGTLRREVYTGEESQ